MSASDAAPLPRLGEVFFDVRGSSRSMRLSWYADTGVAVFSIWQGGVCTGTFRLPIDDLPRMVETLQRGPQGQGRRVPPAPAGWDPYGATTANVPPGYPERQDLPRGYPQRDESASSYPYDARGNQQFNDAEGGADYGQERFVPPYVRAPEDEFPFDNPVDEAEYRSDYGVHAFRRGRPPVPSDTDSYPGQQWSSAGYSDDPPYR